MVWTIVGEDGLNIKGMATAQTLLAAATAAATAQTSASRTLSFSKEAENPTVL